MRSSASVSFDINSKQQITNTITLEGSNNATINIPLDANVTIHISGGGVQTGGMATVHGDIHDIGKNIVKVVLESYGYKIIDLGKDVPPETIVEAYHKHQPKAIGLSALMTTTVVSMEKTIALLKEVNNMCPIFVGGAVLTADFAKEINADFYVKDAMDTVELMNKIVK